MYAYLVREEERSGVAKRAVMALALLVVMAVAMAAMASPARAADLFVTSNADAGPGTLRAAVQVANGNGVADNIFFSLPSDQHTITLGNELLFTATEQTTIYGGTAGVTVSGGNTTRVFYVGYGGNLSLKNLTVSGGSSADDSGGGIKNDNGTLSVTDSTISGNSADYSCGAIFNLQGTVSVTDSTVSGNSANLFNGGGICNTLGTLNVTDSTISGNFATLSGGGIYNYTDMPGQRTTIVNSTISGNTAQEYGGGVFNANGLTTISYSTITNNTAPAGLGAGVASRGNTLTDTVVGSSIIAVNSSTDVDYVVDSYNSFLSEGYNLIGDGNATDASFNAFNNTGDQIIANDSPGLGPLADNGAPTETHALLAGSPALGTIAQGTNGCGTAITQDQRGVSRPQGSACDTGSFELGGDATSPTITSPKPSPDSTIRARTPLISAVVRDTLDGTTPATLSKSNIKLYLDGNEKATFSYNATTGKLTYKSGRLARGSEHTVEVVATDAAGNTTSMSWSFKIRG